MWFFHNLEYYIKPLHYIHVKILYDIKTESKFKIKILLTFRHASLNDTRHSLSIIDARNKNSAQIINIYTFYILKTTEVDFMISYYSIFNIYYY